MARHKQMRQLTRAEEQIMQILWKIGKGFAKDILARFPEPKPAYSTVSTIIRILVQKGFVAYRAYGKTHEYYPLITFEQYKGFETGKLLSEYYENSLGSLVSFFIQKRDVDVREADKIIRLLKEFKEDQK